MGKRSNKVIRFHSVNAFPKDFQKNFCGPPAAEKGEREKSRSAPPRK
jgi:hypothetical protein